jgi:hypothetical protein
MRDSTKIISSVKKVIFIFYMILFMLGFFIGGFL